MPSFKSLLLICAVSALAFISSVFSDLISDGPKRNKVIYCGACLALAQELDWYVGTTPEKQKIETGGFRLDPKGNLVTKKVPLKRSEIHLNEIFEYICRRMTTYNEVVTDGKVNYIPSESRDGHKISTKGVRVSADVGHSLEFACDTILEEYEDTLIPMFQKMKDDYEVGEKLCVEMTGLCSREQFASQKEAFEKLGLNAAGNPNQRVNDIIEDLDKEAGQQDDFARKMEALRDQGLDIHSRDDIERLMAEYDGEIKRAEAAREYDDDDYDDDDWEYGVPPPPTDRNAGRDEL